MYDLGSRLKSIRIQRGLTQRALARKVNKSVSAISSYESNAQMPPLDVLESIVRVLNVSIDYLVGLSNSNTYSTDDLTPGQKEVIDLLYQEFSSSDIPGNELTHAQINIVLKLLLIFISKQQKENRS